MCIGFVPLSIIFYKKVQNITIFRLFLLKLFNVFSQKKEYYCKQQGFLIKGAAHRNICSNCEISAF